MPKMGGHSARPSSPSRAAGRREKMLFSFYYSTLRSFIETAEKPQKVEKLGAIEVSVEA
jgi:hypothetical protein